MALLCTYQSFAHVSKQEAKIPVLRDRDSKPQIMIYGKRKARIRLQSGRSNLLGGFDWCVTGQQVPNLVISLCGDHTYPDSIQTSLDYHIGVCKWRCDHVHELTTRHLHINDSFVDLLCA